MHSRARQRHGTHTGTGTAVRSTHDRILSRECHLLHASVTKVHKLYRAGERDGHTQS